MPETLELPTGQELQEAVVEATESAQQWFNVDNIEGNDD